MASKKNKEPLEVLREAVEAAREAGLEVRAVVTKNEEGVTTTRNL